MNKFEQASSNGHQMSLAGAGGTMSERGGAWAGAGGLYSEVPCIMGNGHIKTPLLPPTFNRMKDRHD